MHILASFGHECLHSFTCLSLLVQAEAVLKGTNVDGVYDCNSQDNNFTFKHISFRELVSRGATTMDMAALTFCEENNIPGTYACLCY